MNERGDGRTTRARCVGASIALISVLATPRVAAAGEAPRMCLQPGVTRTLQRLAEAKALEPRTPGGLRLERLDVNRDHLELGYDDDAGPAVTVTLTAPGEGDGSRPAPDARGPHFEHRIADARHVAGAPDRAAMLSAAQIVDGAIATSDLACAPDLNCSDVARLSAEDMARCGIQKDPGSVSDLASGLLEMALVAAALALGVSRRSLIPTGLLALAAVVGAFDVLLEPSASTLALDALLLFVWVVPVVASARRLREGLRSVPAWEWLCLAGSATIALCLRLAGGVRVPGYNNNHGFGTVAAILDGSPFNRDALHGNGLLTLHKVLLVVVPRTEAGVIGIQVACSVLTTFAIWGLARALTGPREAAGAALTWAVLPGPVFYAMTEVHQVPGALFVTLALLLLVLAIRREDLRLFGAALLAAIAALQFVTVLLMLPVMMALFALATPEGRRMLRRPDVRVPIAVFAAALVPSVVRMLGSFSSNPAVYGRMIPTPLLFLRALVPAIGDDPGNRWLNPSFTPVALAILSAVGAAVGLRRAGTRWTTAAVLATALLLSSVQLETRGMDGMRHQLMAQGFYAVLTGCGLREVVDFVADRFPRLSRRAWAVAGAALVLGSVVVWPGPRSVRYTSHFERGFLTRAVATLPAPCTILVPDGSVLGEVPSYLSAEAGRDHRWVHVSDPVAVADGGKECVLWYRPAECWDCRSFGAARRADDCEEQRAECRRIEEGLRLEPLLTEQVPAIRDADQQYTRERLEIGFFRVLGAGRSQGR